MLEIEPRVGDPRLERERFAEPGGEGGRVGGVDVDHGTGHRVLQLARGARRHDLAAVEEGEPVAAVGLVERVRREQDRDALALARLDELPPEASARDGVEAGRRLVEEEEAGRVQHRLGDLDPPGEAAREGLDQVAGSVGELEAGEELVRPGGQAGAREAVQMALVAQVLGDGQLLVEARGLEYDADRGPDRAGLGRDVVPEDARRARRRGEQGRQDAEERALPAPVGAEESEDLPARDLEVDALEGGPLPEGPSEATGLGGQFGSGHDRTPYRPRPPMSGESIPTRTSVRTSGTATTIRSDLVSNFRCMK